MPIFDEKQLEKTATGVVDRFFTEKLALTDGIVNAAEQQNLNPEQIKRLVEAVNNMTFLQKFNEGGEDRLSTSEFQPADANAAISRMLDAAKDLMHEMPSNEPTPTEESCGCDTADLPITRPEVPEMNPIEGEEITPAGEPNIRGTVVIMKLRKTAELLRDQQYQTRVEFTDTVQKLATGFNKVNALPFETFEKDAFYNWGDRAAPHLNLLRGALKLPEATYDHTAMTKIARVVDSRSPEMTLFNRILNCYDNITKLSQAQQRVNTHLQTLEA